MKKFLLDLDGPCSLFIHGALKALNKEELIDNYPQGASNLSEITGVPYPEMYKAIDSLKENFWRNLEETPTFKELYNGLQELGKVYFCTSPSLDSNSLKGKVLWLQDRFGFQFRDYIITYNKFLCASPNTILIDDTLEQCQSFIDNGGDAVQFPTALNSLGESIPEKDRAKYVLAKIKEIL